ncbi:MAG: antitoxin [Methyloprofundus sp.]|nr:MAG: antitoxin [Methyloprofundus sp.]
MAQLHFYLPDSLADSVRLKAEHAHLSVSKYLAELVKREVTNQWPENYFDNFGQWDGDVLQRPDQDALEQREILD